MNSYTTTFDLLNKLSIPLYSKELNLSSVLSTNFKPNNLLKQIMLNRRV